MAPRPLNGNRGGSGRSGAGQSGSGRGRRPTDRAPGRSTGPGAKGGQGRPDGARGSAPRPGRRTPGAKPPKPREKSQEKFGNRDGAPKPPRGEAGETRRPRSRAEQRRDPAASPARAAKRERRRATADAARESLRPEPGWDLLHGRRPVIEALRANRQIERVFVATGTEERGAVAEIKLLARKHGVDIRDVPRSVLDAEVEDAPHQGVAALVAPIDTIRLDELLALPMVRGETPFFLAVDAVTDPHNLGALARSADAAGCHGILVPRHNRAPLSPAAVKASAGALQHVPVAEVTNLTRGLEKLKASGVWCLGLAEGADHNLFKLELADEPICVVVGGEGRGLHRLVRETCDQLVSIPMGGQVASLNVSVAGALALYEIRRRRGHQPTPTATPS